MAILEVKDLKKSFGDSDVLKGISFSLEEKNVLAIIGSSGSGKTTLLRCINMLETADSGSITVDGGVVFDSDRAEKLTAEQKRENQLKIGLVFQSFNLVTRTTVIKNVLSACVPDMPFWRVLLGTFRNEEFGTYTRYTYYKPESCVVVRMGEKVLVLSGKDKTETQEIYDQLLTHTTAQ